MIRGRRSEQFHDLVEDISAGDVRSSYGGLLEVVAALRAVPTPEPDPAFVRALRERVVEEAHSVLTAAAAERAGVDERLRLPSTPPRIRRRNRRLAAAISGVIIVGASGTMAVASQTALPGDRLYPLKRGLESAHAQLTFDRGARGGVLLDSASTRLDEAAQLSREGASSDQVAQTLDAFTQEALDGSDLLISDYQATGDESSITAVRAFTAASMARLGQLQDQVPAGSVDQLLQAAQALDQVQQVAVQACPTCAGPSVTEVPSVLTRSAQAAADSWLVALPRGSHAGPTPGGVTLPHISGPLPPASVTDPSQTTADPGPATAHDVRTTLQHLTSGLTDNHQSDLGSTVTDTANNLLDAVGDVGNTVAGTVDGVLGSVGSALPTDLPTLP